MAQRGGLALAHLVCVHVLDRRHVQQGHAYRRSKETKCKEREEDSECKEGDKLWVQVWIGPGIGSNHGREERAEQVYRVDRAPLKKIDEELE